MIDICKEIAGEAFYGCKELAIYGRAGYFGIMPTELRYISLFINDNKDIALRIVFEKKAVKKHYEW